MHFFLIPCDMNRVVSTRLLLPASAAAKDLRRFPQNRPRLTPELRRSCSDFRERNTSAGPYISPNPRGISEGWWCSLVSILCLRRDKPCTRNPAKPTVKTHCQHTSTSPMGKSTRPVLRSKGRGARAPGPKEALGRSAWRGLRAFFRRGEGGREGSQQMPHPPCAACGNHHQVVFQENLPQDSDDGCYRQTRSNQHANNTSTACKALPLNPHPGKPALRQLLSTHHDFLSRLRDCRLVKLLCCLLSHCLGLPASSLGRPLQGCEVLDRPQLNEHTRLRFPTTDSNCT